MAGYRTILVAFLLLVSGITARFGIEFDPEALADMLIIIAPSLMIIMRMFTRTPIGKAKQ